MPVSAWAARFLPSNENGLVTTPTVRAPNSRAISAMTGAAPVPVPPPLPAVTNTMSAPLSASRNSSRLSSAACAADLRVRSRTQSPRDLAADVDLHVGIAHQQGLRIGVDRDELDAPQSGVDHAIHRIGSPAADADDLDDREVAGSRIDHRCLYLHHVGHPGTDAGVPRNQDSTTT